MKNYRVWSIFSYFGLHQRAADVVAAADINLPCSTGEFLASDKSMPLSAATDRASDQNNDRQRDREYQDKLIRDMIRSNAHL